MKKFFSKLKGLSIDFKKIFIRLFILIVLFNVLLIIISLFVKIDNIDSQEDNLFPSSISLLNFDNSRKHQIITYNDLIDKSIDLEENIEYGKSVYRFTSNSSISFSINIENNGEYEIALDYLSLQTDVQDISINLIIDESENNTYKNILLPTYWKNTSTEEVYDIYQNEVSPPLSVCSMWAKQYLYDQRFYEKDPLSFTLKKGIHTITIEKMNGSFLLGDIFLIEKTNYKSYTKFDDYESNQNVYIIEGEDPVLKSDSSITSTSTKFTHLTPFSTSKNMHNNLSGDSFNESGESVTYAFEIKEDGYYNIALKYYISQTNTSVYTKVLIDNIILYDELNNYRIDNHLNNRKASYDLEALSTDNEDITFHFTKGIHYLTLQLDSSKQAPIYDELVKMIDEINELYLEIVKLTGGNTDKNKNWNIGLYIPTAKTRLDDWKNRSSECLKLINEVSKSNPKRQNRLYQQIDNAYKKIVELSNDPNKLPHKLSLLYEGSASASLMLSNSLHTSTFNPLSIDKIYVYGTEYELPKIRNNFFINYFATVQKIIKTNVKKTSEDEVNIWVNRSTYYVSMMQQFSDAYYTPNSGIKVRFNLLPDESKLTYANASNTQPDAAIGVGSSTPYALGMRGALVNLRQMPGFGLTLSEFAAGSLLPYIKEDAVYGLPETQDFQVTFYRKDILESLGLSVPNTYEEIVDILPTLQRFGMNYYMPMAGGSGLKSLSITAPFIYQYGGEIYSEDYLNTRLDSKEGIKAMTMMVDLFSIYSLPLTTQNFYNDFRSGLSPIGISGFDTYLQLSNAAPEIIGKWNLALAPGVEDEKGLINRTQTGDSKAVIIFEKSHKKQEAWDFLKWWLSKETQIKYANDIQATYGKTFLWNTANLKAFATLAIPENDKEIILKQWEYLHQVPQTPATYMFERGISNAWNACVFNKVSVRAAITDYSLEINREAIRKMIEFKYLDKKGNTIKKYYIPSIDEIKSWQMVR